VRTLCFHKYLSPLHADKIQQTDSPTAHLQHNSEDNCNYIAEAPTISIQKAFKMLLLATIVKLISPLRSMLEASPTHNLTELLATDAITASLDSLIEIQADLSEFAENVKVLFAKHFPADYIGNQDRHDPSSMNFLRINQAVIVKELGTVYDPENSPCAFAPHVIDHCEELVPRSGSFLAVLQAEGVRTRECVARSITPAAAGIYALGSRWLEECRDMYSMFSTNFSGSSMPRDEQDYEFRKRYLSYADDLLELKANTPASRCRVMERYYYLDNLKTVYRTAAKNSAIVVSLDGSVSLDDWHAIDSYWKTLCQVARGQLLEGEEDADNSTTSLLPEMFQQPTFT
jgi:hypothetical protein